MVNERGRNYKPPELLASFLADAGSTGIRRVQGRHIEKHAKKDFESSSAMGCNAFDPAEIHKETQLFFRLVAGQSRYTGTG